MSWKFEHVYDSNGTELSTANLATTLDGAADFCYDGRYVWVSAGSNGVAVYEFWGANSDDEPAFEDLDELMYPRYDSGVKKKLRLVTFIKITGTTVQRVTREPSLADDGATKTTLNETEFTYYKSNTVPGALSLNGYHVVYNAGKVYVSNGATFTNIFEFDVNTQQFVRVIEVGETYSGLTNEWFASGSTYGMNSNLCAAGGKLWFVGASWGDDAQQRLYSYNPLTDVKTTTNIPVRPTRTRTWIADGYNGYVYITNHNNVSVSKFNVETGAFVSIIRTNALPTRIFSGPDRRIWVSSFAGMLTLVDWDDDQTHNNWGTETTILSGNVDPTDTTKFWWIRTDGVLSRMNLNDGTRLQTVVLPTKELQSTEVGIGSSVQTQNTLGTPVENDIAHVTNTITGVVHEYVAVLTDAARGVFEWEYTGEVPEDKLRDWNFSHSKLPKPKKIDPAAAQLELVMFTPQIEYTGRSGAAHTVVPYMFMLRDGKLLSIRMNKYLYRDVFAEINGQAAVVANSMGYFGE